jgi:hypothetical protein
VTVLKKPGFKFKKYKKKSSLIDTNDILVQNATYLKRMKKNYEMGSNKKPMYLGQTWIHLIYTVKTKCQVSVYVSNAVQQSAL